MRDDINEVKLVGSVGKDPTLSYQANSQAVCRFSVATHYRVAGPGDGHEIKTEWHECVILGKSAESMHGQILKGHRVFVSGTIRTQRWKNANSVPQSKTEILAKQVIPFGSAGYQP